MSLTWPLVGREGELQLIRDAMTGTGTGIVLAGAPGVGKTRLAHEAISGADPGRHLVLWAAATAATTPVSLGALAPLLPAQLPANPLAMLRAATDALLDRCGTRRLVLAVDDAHLLDEMSATLVHQLARTRRAFVLVSFRSRHAVPDPIRALWKDSLAVRVEIESLSPAVTAEVLAAALGGQVDGVTSRRLWQVVQGDMLVLRELVQAGIDSGALTEIAGVWRWEGRWVTTPRIVELVSDRIGHLARREREVLEIVAYGEPIGADLLMSLADRQVVEEVESRALLRAATDGRRVDVQLAHPLYGEVLRARCSPRRAAALRHRLAAAVEATGARREDDWLRIATWRLDACAPVRADMLVAAADRALTRLDLPLAERLARTAFAVRADPAAGAVLWRVLLFSQRWFEAEEVLAGLSGTPVPDSHRGDFTLGRAGNLFWGLHRIDEAFALLRTTREVIDDPARQDEIDLLECVFLLLQANLVTAQRGLAQLHTRRPLSPRVAAQVPVARAVLLVHMGRPALARDMLDQAAEPLSRWSEQVPWVSEVCRAYRCCAALLAGRIAEAGELARALHTHALHTEWAFALQLSCLVQAQVARLRGQVRTAVRWAREGLRHYELRRDAPFRNCVLGELAHAHALAGHGAAAVAALQDADRRPTPAEALLQPWIELARPWVSAATGDLDRAGELATATATQARHQQATLFEAFALHDAVRLGVVHSGAPHEVADRLQELAGIVDGDLVLIFARHATAVADGDPVALENTGAAFAGLGAELLAAEAYVQAAHAYRRRGAAASDRRLRAQAALLLDACEGARTPLVAGIEAPQLTTRERQIARLAAGGLSNQQIADRMVISPRTVGNHLHHVYTKLGIGGRSALAGLLPSVGSDG